MKSRWLIVSAVIVAASLASGAAATGSSPCTRSMPPVAVAPELQAQTPATDPYAGSSPFTTTAPPERQKCQIYASDCVFDGGPCGPQNLCHCLNGPDGWICAR
jgi:hypothetical protein